MNKRLFLTPPPVTHRIRGEKKNVNSNYPAPNYHITDWQQGMLKFLGDLDPRDFNYLWIVASNVSPNATSRIPVSVINRRLGIVTRHGPAVYNRLIRYGLVTDKIKFPVRNCLQKANTYLLVLNRCILKGELPKDCVLDGIQDIQPWTGDIVTALLRDQYVNRAWRDKNPYTVKTVKTIEEMERSEG